MYISIHCLLCLSWCGAVSAVSSVDMNILPPVPTRVQICTVNTLALTTLVMLVTRMVSMLDRGCCYQVRVTSNWSVVPPRPPPHHHHQHQPLILQYS